MHSVFHAGEIEVQTRAGVREMAKRVGNGIHAVIPSGVAEFLAEHPMVIVGSRNQAGHVWASILTGEPGFLRAGDERTLHIHAAPVPGDPFAAILSDMGKSPSASLDLGLLVIDLATRDRLRLNGTAEVEPSGEIRLHTREVYFNCPKYIQAREVTEVAPASTSQSAVHKVTRSSVLSAEQRAWVAGADTFFVASVAPGGGADASHRGGNPGFIHVRDAATLEWPDYSGNMMFNTLGNITACPSTGLLFLDFDRGDTLQLTGQATVLWEPEHAAHFPGAQRVVKFHIDQAVQITQTVPLHFRFLQYSRFNPA